MGREHERRGHGTRAAVGALVAAGALVATAGAAYADPVVSGAAYVGGTITVTDEHGCDVVNATLQILRPLGGGSSAVVTNANGSFVTGQDVILSAVLPAVDFGGTPLEAGQTLVASLDGICFGFGDMFGIEFGEVEFVLGSPPAGTETTTTTTTEPTTTTVAVAAPTTSPAPTAPAVAPAAAPIQAAGDQATLPRTGASPGVLVAAAVAFLTVGAALARTARVRRPSPR